MSSIETQIEKISEKIDALQTLIENLNQNLEGVITLKQPGTVKTEILAGTYQALNQDLSNHKDVLDEEKQSSRNARDSGATLSADIQIQRLTAQLTAAYGRIAALEEQLLSRREHQR